MCGLTVKYKISSFDVRLHVSVCLSAPPPCQSMPGILGGGAAVIRALCIHMQPSYIIREGNPLITI